MATNRTATRAWRSLRQRAIAEALDQGRTDCPICGTPIAFGTHRRPDSPELDHIVPFAVTGIEVPPIEDVRIICRKCNRARAEEAKAAVATEVVEPFPTSRAW